MLFVLKSTPSPTRFYADGKNPTTPNRFLKADQQHDGAQIKTKACIGWLGGWRDIEQMRVQSSAARPSGWAHQTTICWSVVARAERE